MDKRTKEYKEWKKSQPSEGVGDTVKKITDATGISNLVEKLFGPNCGCDERQKYLNKILPYKSKYLTKEEYIYLTVLFEKLDNKLSFEQRNRVMKIYQRVINPKQQHTNCQKCWIKIINQLKQLVGAYK